MCDKLICCEDCGMKFKNNYNKNRHKQMSCKTVKEKEKGEIQKKLLSYEELKIENDAYKKENIRLQKIIDELQEYKENYIELLKKTSDTNSKLLELNIETSGKSMVQSMSTMKFVTKNMVKAPPLRHEKQEIAGLLEYTESKKHQPVDYIFHNYSIKKLDSWIGDIIVKIYKKENPFDQSVWSTDTNRYSYLICEVVESASGKKNEWITDKSGIKVTDIIIDPTLKIVDEMLDEYLEEAAKKSEKVDELEIDEISKLMYNKQRAMEIKIKIENNDLHKDILKYVTPFLCADIKKIEDAMIKSFKTENMKINQNDEVHKEKNKDKDLKKNSQTEICYTSSDESIESSKYISNTSSSAESNKKNNKTTKLTTKNEKQQNKPPKKKHNKN